MSFDQCLWSVKQINTVVPPTEIHVPNRHKLSDKLIPWTSYIRQLIQQRVTQNVVYRRQSTTVQQPSPLATISTRRWQVRAKLSQTSAILLASLAHSQRGVGNYLWMYRTTRNERARCGVFQAVRRSVEHDSGIVSSTTEETTEGRLYSHNTRQRGCTTYDALQLKRAMSARHKAVYLSLRPHTARGGGVTLWRSLLPYWYSYKASCTGPG